MALNTKNSKLVFNEDSTDWSYDIVPGSVNFTLRLKRKLKRKPKIKSLSLHDVSSVRQTDFQDANERLSLLNAYGAIKTARALRTKNLHRDSFLHLHLAVEHLTKFVFVKCKYAYFKKFEDQIPLLNDGNGKGIDQSHDVSAILRALLNYVTDLKSEVPDIDGLLRALARTKDKGHWSSLRYFTNPQDQTLNEDFSNYYKLLMKELLKFHKKIHEKALLA